MKRGHRAGNSDGHIAYTRIDGYDVMKDLIPWTSDWIIGRMSIGFAFVIYAEYLCVFAFCDGVMDSECPFVGRSYSFI